MQDLRFKDPSALAKHLAGDLANRMRKTISNNGQVYLALSGGKTPLLFLQALAKEDLAWDKVIITLVDERWVDENNTASNAQFIKQNLLKGAAKNAYFIALKNTQKTPIDGFMQCENILQEQMPVLNYAVLGMGLDGHTASWFPHSKALRSIFNEESNAFCTPVMDAPEYAERITLNWSFLSKCKHIFLHIEGTEKDALILKAQESDDFLAMPIRKILKQDQVPVSIYRTF